MPLHIDSPLLNARELSDISGKKVWLKIDAMQPTGSFKLRGIGAACEAYKAQGKSRFVSSSGGNAGFAAAYAGRLLGVPVTVVIPESTSPHMKSVMEREGATVIVKGAVWSEANQFAHDLVDENSAFIHPFDDPLVWNGHASLVDEVVRAGANFDAVILSVGGGGLLSGIAEGLERNGLGEIPIVAVETEGADCLAKSIAAGSIQTLPAITSIATSLGANRVCDRAFEITQTRNVHSIVVSDLEALEACEQFLGDQRILVEPACAASLAALYAPHHRASLENLRSPLVVVCGGVTVTLGRIREWTAAIKAQDAR